MNARMPLPQSTRRFARPSSHLLVGGIAAALLLATTAVAVDYSEGGAESQLKSGLDKVSFSEAFKQMTADNFRIADIETYRSGRSTSVTTLWTKLAADERWAIEMSLPIADFIKADEKNREKGFSLVEFEIDRVGGATLLFSGIWTLRPNGPAAEFYYGMESLEFSNRYGEMADRGFRLVDFEAYESIGKFRHAGLWMKNDEDLDVRFYRAIPRANFATMVETMKASGFRVLDVEGYQFEGSFVFAAEWTVLSPAQESVFEYDLMPDEFYSKNATLLSQGFRLTEFEVYEERDTLFYAGSWLKVATGAAAQAKAAEEKKKSKPASLEAFRSGQ